MTASLRRRLLSLTLLSVAVALALIVGLSYRAMMHEIAEVFDAELAQTARLIGRLAVADIDSRGGDLAVAEDPRQEGHRYEKHLSYQVWFHDSLVLRSALAPTRPLAHSLGYSDHQIEGKSWRVFGLEPEAGLRIFSAEDSQARDELAWEVAYQPLLVLVGVLALLIPWLYFGIERALRDLRRVSEAIGRRDIENLSAIDDSAVPNEIHPLIAALNALLERLRAAIGRERQFIANASHELRTPLAGIRLHTQLALHSEDRAEVQNALRNVIRGIDRSTHLVAQLLALARLSSEQAVDAPRAITPTALIDDLLHELRPAAQAAGVRLESRAAPDLPDLTTHPELLRVLLRNLLDNAIRYAGTGAEVVCAVGRDAGGWRFEVADNGPGIPEAQLSRARERFIRFGGQDSEGCGLGLSIAETAARHLGGRLELANRPQGGLIARCVLPAARGLETQ